MMQTPSDDEEEGTILEESQGLYVDTNKVIDILK